MLRALLTAALALAALIAGAFPNDASAGGWRRPYRDGGAVLYRLPSSRIVTLPDDRQVHGS